jgi:hypothetical protein
VRRSKVIVIFVLTLVFLLALTSIAAIPSGKGNPNGMPVFEKAVFIHYGNDVAHGKPIGAPGGSKNKTPALYSYSKTHWSASDIPVTYGINSTGTPVNDTVFINAVEASFATWNAAGTGIDFNYDPEIGDSPELNPVQPDDVNMVGWANLGAGYSGVIGITITWYYRFGGEKIIVDCDTILNLDSEFNWVQVIKVTDPDNQTIPQTTRYDVDVQNIMTHEAGHWLQLNDLYDSVDAVMQQTMYGYADDGELKARSLENGDISGLHKIYP